MLYSTVEVLWKLSVETSILLFRKSARFYIGFVLDYDH